MMPCTTIWMFTQGCILPNPSLWLRLLHSHPVSMPFLTIRCFNFSSMVAMHLPSGGINADKKFHTTRWFGSVAHSFKVVLPIVRDIPPSIGFKISWNDVKLTMLFKPMPWKLFANIRTQSAMQLSLKSLDQHKMMVDWICCYHTVRMHWFGDISQCHLGNPQTPQGVRKIIHSFANSFTSSLGHPP